MSSLISPSSITSLRLSDCGLCDKNAGVLGVLTMQAPLTYLDVSLNDLKHGVLVMASALEYNTRLTALNLSSSNIDDSGGQALGAALRRNSGLSALNLSGNLLLESAAAAFGEALGVNGSLKYLDLRWNPIPTEGIASLAEGLQTNSTLTALRVGGLCSVEGMEITCRIQDTLHANRVAQVKKAEQQYLSTQTNATNEKNVRTHTYTDTGPRSPHTPHRQGNLARARERDKGGDERTSELRSLRSRVQQLEAQLALASLNS